MLDSLRAAGERGSEEIDVVGVARSRVSLVGECKWTAGPMTRTRRNLPGPGIQSMQGFAMSKPAAAELATFLGPVADRDAEVIERWRDASPAAHARAMIELSDYAERMAAQTGLGKDPAERFPGIPKLPSRQRPT